MTPILPITTVILLVTVLAGCGGKKVADVKLSAKYKSTSAAIKIGGQDWPWWRGQKRNGTATGAVPPLDWKDEKLVRWRRQIDISGHASPIVVGNRVFIAGSTEKPSQSLLCLDRASGQEVWHRVLHESEQLRMHHTNSQASATPASDGHRVFVAMVNRQEKGDSLVVSAIDMDGKIAWQTNTGRFRSRHGFGSSPVIYKSLVIVAGDNNGPGSLTALDRATGDVVWRRGRQSSDSYATPIIASVGGKDRLLIHGQGKASCYDPANGEPLWDVAGPAKTAANSMNWAGDLVFASAGYPERNFFALNVSDGSQAWSKRIKVYVPSFVVHDQWIYLVQDNGVASCLNTTSGEEGWKKRLGGSFSSSIVVAADNLFATSESGTVYVFKANPKKYEPIARNSIGERVMSTPAICGGEVFIRSESSVICYAKK